MRAVPVTVVILKTRESTFFTERLSMEPIAVGIKMSFGVFGVIIKVFNILEMLMFFDEGFGSLPGFGFEFKAIDGGVIILVFIKGVAEFVEGLKSKISKRRVVKESGLIEIDHFRITKREAGFEIKMIIGILGA